MPWQAPIATTLSERRPGVNSSEISTARARCEARMRVICDAAVPAGAKVLYVLLDDYSRMKGICWPKQETLAEKLGVTRRQIIRQLDSLEGAGYLVRRRGRRGLFYQLFWGARAAPADVTSTSHQESGLDVTSMSPRSDIDVTSPPYISGGVLETGVAARPMKTETEAGGSGCPHCHGTGERWYEAEHRAAVGGRNYVRRWKGKCGCLIV